MVRRRGQAAFACGTTSSSELRTSRADSGFSRACPGQLENSQAWRCARPWEAEHHLDAWPLLQVRALAVVPPPGKRHSADRQLKQRDLHGGEQEAEPRSPF